MKRFLFVILAMLPPLWSSMAATESPRGPMRGHGDALDFAQPNAQNRVHREGNVWMNITNHGFFGNAGPGQYDAVHDPCPPNMWAPQCEFPAGSMQEYLFQAALWVGAIVVENEQETPRVSVGTDGWLNPSINEFWPGEGDSCGVIERSNEPGKINCFGDPVYSPAAVANEEFIATYSDTLTDQQYVVNDPVDGPHHPLGIQVQQISREWSSTSFGDFIICQYHVQNIGNEFLKNVYLGLYVDGDVGRADMLNQHVDDITGFKVTDPATGDTVNIPWIADNDGRDPNATSGPLIVPHVIGTYTLTPPTQATKFSYNWWISNGDGLCS
jgi:hypothetical protein